MISNKIVITLRNELLLHVHWEDEGTPPRIAHIPWAPGQPGVVREAPDCFSELGADQDQSVIFIVTPLMESSSFEAVLWGPEELLNPDWVAEDLIQEA